MKVPTKKPSGSQLDRYSRRAKSNATATALRDRGANWSSFALATGSAVALATNASAGIIYSGPINITSTAPALSAGADDDQFTIGGSQFHLYAIHNFTPPYAGTTARVGLIGGPYGRVMGRFNTLHLLESGDLMGPENFLLNKAFAAFRVDYGGSAVGVDGIWQDGAGPRMAGFRLGGSGANNDSLFNYGWIRLEVTYGDARPGTGKIPYSITALEWAYDDTGAAIHAGDTGLNETPEPGTESLALLALGTAAVAALRRRKQAAVSTE